MSNNADSGLMLNVEQARVVLGGIGRHTLLGLIATGQIRAARYGRRWLIPRAALEEFAQRAEGQTKPR